MGAGTLFPAGLYGLHTLSLLLAPLVAHDCATEDTHTHTVVPALKTLGLSQLPALKTRFVLEAWCPVIANI